MTDFNLFTDELCTYLASISATFIVGTNLNIGELIRTVDGVFVTSTGSPALDAYNPVETYLVDFTAIHRNSQEAYNFLQEISRLFHQRQDYDTDNYHVYYSRSMGQITDLDRSGEGRKILRLSVLFITYNLIS